MSFQTIKSTYECALKNERHDTVAETRYWCGQYKLMAKWAIEELERKAIAEAEKQEPEGDLLDDARAVLEIIVHDQPVDTFRDARALIPKLRERLGLPPIINFNHPQPKREPLACVIDGKLMAYKNGPLPDNCLLYDQAL